MILVLSKEETFLCVLENDNSDACPYKDDIHHEKLNDSYSTYPFSVPLYHDDAKFLVRENKVVIQDLDGNSLMFTIKDTEIDTNSNLKHVQTLNSGLELLGKRIMPQTIQATDVNDILDRYLDGTRWKRGRTDWAGTRTVVIEQVQTAVKSIHDLRSLFDLELQYRVELKNGKISDRYVDLVERIGNFTGKRIENAKDLIEVRIKEHSNDLYTALVGVGPQQDDGTPMTFADVEWSIANGDPLDKPLGQAWLGDPDALEKWGIEGVHITGEYVYSGSSDITPIKLLELTYEQLKKSIEPVETFEIKFADLENVIAGDGEDYSHEKVRMGDTITVYHYGIDDSTAIQARVIELKRSKSNPLAGEMILGDYKRIALKKSPIIESIQKRLLNYETVLGAQKKADNAKVIAIDTASLDATSKANAAQQAAEEYAFAKAEAERIKAEAYADGIVSAEEQARINDANEKLAVAKSHAEQKAADAQGAAELYTRQQLTNYVSAITYNQEISDIQSQIDGNITSWFYNYEPTLSNEPVSLWTTNEIKNNHLGDLFYNTSNGYSYRFSLENGVYTWILLKDSDVQKALADAAKAQDTADSKRRTFVNQPVSPYDVGDLWVQGTNGEIMKCQTAKAQGQTFSSANWIKASKYTDDSRAVQAEENAIAYTNTQVSQLDEEITHQLTLIEQNASDILLRAEKTVVEGIDSRLTSAVASIQTNAEQISLRVTKTEFDNLQIGGRNLIRKSRIDVEGTPMTTDGEYAFYKPLASGNWRISEFTQREKGIYSLSFWAKVATAGTIMVDICDGYNTDFNLTTEWQYFKMENKNVTSGYLGATYYGFIDFFAKTNVGTLYLKEVKLENGTKCTGFSPAPEDIDSDISGLDGRITTAESSITSNAEQIQLRVTKSTYDTDINNSGGLKARMSSAESSITQNANNINLKVSKDGVISSINQTAETIKIAASKIDINGAVTFSSFDSTTKGVLSNADASIINANPNFLDWTGTYPSGYSGLSGTGMSKVSSGNGMGNAVKYVVALNTNSYLSPNQITNQPYYQYVTVETTFMLESGTIDGAGVLFRYNATANSDHKIHLKDLIASPTLNKWYTVSKIIKQATTPSGFTGYTIFPMGGWTSFIGTITAKTIQFDSVKTRPSTEQEIASYENDVTISGSKSTWDRASNINSNGTFNTSKLSGTVSDSQVASATKWNNAESLLNSWKSGTTLINGGMLATNSVFATSMVLSDWTNLCENPDFELDNVGSSPRGYTNVYGRVADISAFSGGNGSNRALEIDSRNGANADAYSSNLIPVQAGQQFYVEFEGRHLNTVGTGSTGVGFRTYDEKRVAQSTWVQVATFGSAKTTVFTKKSGSYTVPSGVGYLQIFITFANNAETTNKFYVDNIRINRKSAGELIVDGAVTADKINVTSLAALSANLGKVNAGEITGSSFTTTGTEGTIDIRNDFVHSVKTLSGSTDKSSSRLTSVIVSVRETSADLALLRSAAYLKSNQLEFEGLYGTYTHYEKNGFNGVARNETTLVNHSYSMEFDPYIQGFEFSAPNGLGINGQSRMTSDSSYFRVLSPNGGANQMRFASNGEFALYQNGSYRHLFKPDGSKIGGSIEIEGKVWGMSPIDSPQVKISLLLTDIELTEGIETTIAYEERFYKATANIAIFPSNPNVEVITKLDGSFTVVASKDCKTDFFVIGERLGYEGTYFTDMDAVYGNAEGVV
ncbi:phage tail spike protein [Metabacillus bambusae]|uniref:Phage tail protein n=1 Tax=Metabacillus bambusae TaxID=2795218 RepID=A0ABS3N9V8_9BACI|nr:phage tail spike protein [Metabacillus bambusae]MBO1515059.1 phage tail protein [Metabacillus bambusae]